MAAGITYTTLNGAFDLFVCPNSIDPSSGWFRPVDISNGMRIVFNSANGLQLLVTSTASLGLGSAPGSFTTNSTWALPGAITSTSNPFTTGLVTHLGITFNTNALTGQITMKVFAVQGTGSITTSSNTNLLATQSFYASAAAIGPNPLPSGAWTMTQPSSSTINTSVDYDTVRLYMKDPGTFPGL